METRRDWLTDQLSEFLAAISSYPDESTALRGGVERLAEAVDAEVAAATAGAHVVVAVGFRPGHVEIDGLLEIARGAASVEFAAVGPAHGLAVELESDRYEHIVLARADEPFSRDEQILLRGMVRVLALTLRLLRLLEWERESRRASSRDASEKAALLESLQLRQAMLERVHEIQRAISHRAPMQVVFDSITKAAAELIGADIVALRLIEPDDPGFLHIRSSFGVDQEVLAAIKRTALGDGIGGRAAIEGRLVATTDYSATPTTLRPLADDVGPVMAAPVHRDGRVVGSLTVASHQAAEAYSPAQQQMLLTLAENTSLALNDASALEAIDRAYADALHRATHDDLTGLPNRALVLDRIDSALRRSERTVGDVALFFIDLDRFKVINDSLGHSIGDEVLTTVARRLAEVIRGADTLGRLSGDEFIVVSEDMAMSEAMRFGERLVDAVSAPLNLYGREVTLTASVGIAAGSPPATAENLIRDADVAMYRAKERGRARVELFDEAVRAQMVARVELEQDLRRAIAAGELLLHYQPIVAATSATVVGLEALVRWQHPTRGLIGPDGFIALAEESGIILAIGAWGVSEACRQLAQWQREGSPFAGLPVSVNLSAAQFGDPGLVDLVTAELASWHLPAASLGVEVTESVLMANAEVAVETIHRLKDLGVHVAIDDFGTGYSSLNYLRMFRADTVKIDRCFVQRLDEDANDRIIVDAVVQLAGALGLQVVAEGVETEGQLSQLRDLACATVQGFLFSRPLPPDELAAWAAAHRSNLIAS